MNLNDYLKAAAKRVRTNTNERVGQAYMNELWLVKPELWKLIRDVTEAGYICDPYNNDELLPAFFEVIERNW